MPTRKRIIRNVSWNWLGMAVESAVGFVILPLLVLRLGNDGYGLWILIGSLTGSFHLLDLGFRSSVGRFVAYHFALNDWDGLSRVLSTATLILSGFGLLAFGGVALLSVYFPLIVEVPAGQLDAAQLSLLIVGLHLGLWFVTRIYDGTLWGLQRFDLLNMIDGSLAIVRLALTYMLVTTPDGLVTLALITLAMTVLGGTLKFWLSFRKLRAARLGLQFVNSETARKLGGYGIWNFIAHMSAMSITSLFPVLIGTLLGLAFVAPYAIANRLVKLAATFIVAATGVVAPVNVVLHAQKDLPRQRSLYIEGSKYCACIAMLALVGMCVLGKPFLTLWVGADYTHLSQVVTILAVGMFIPNATTLSRGMLQAIARHRSLAWLGILQAIATFAVAALLGPRFGLTGAAVAVAVSATVCSGISPTLVACRALNLSMTTYLRSVFAPAVRVLMLPTTLLMIAVSIQEPHTWWHFVAYVTTFSLSVLGIATVAFRRDLSTTRSPQPVDATI